MRRRNCSPDLAPSVSDQSPNSRTLGLQKPMSGNSTALSLPWSQPAKTPEARSTLFLYLLVLPPALPPPPGGPTRSPGPFPLMSLLLALVPDLAHEEQVIGRCEHVAVQERHAGRTETLAAQAFEREASLLVRPGVVHGELVA